MKRRDAEDEVSVSSWPYGDDETRGPWPKNWFCVSNDDGEIAYFHRHKDAVMFRTVLINSMVG